MPILTCAKNYPPDKLERIESLIRQIFFETMEEYWVEECSKLNTVKLTLSDDDEGLLMEFTLQQEQV
jgi:hypothetical protein